ncbi:MAG: hypothetical protein GY830_01990 [Bacteroidetes bacterium]|nr:hypothetical protein [Bacteroidota bacterium]
MRKNKNEYIGKLVKLKTNDFQGEIIEINNKKITIKNKNIKLIVSEEQIEFIEKIEDDEDDKVKQKQKTCLIPSNFSSEQYHNFNIEIDLHGLSLEAAINEMDKHIDKAIVLGHKYLKIIHGKGLGILRTGIRKYLSKDSRVHNIMVNNHIFKGGSGITCIELK